MDLRVVDGDWVEQGVEDEDRVPEGVKDTQVVPEVENVGVLVEQSDLEILGLAETLGLKDWVGVRMEDRVPLKAVGEVLWEGVNVRLALPPVALPDWVILGVGVMEGEAEGEGLMLVEAHPVGDCLPLLLKEGLGVKEEDEHGVGVTFWDSDVHCVGDKV